jgi:hypothetical protein
MEEQTNTRKQIHYQPHNISYRESLYL